MSKMLLAGFALIVIATGLAMWLSKEPESNPLPEFPTHVLTSGAIIFSLTVFPVFAIVGVVPMTEVQLVTLEAGLLAAYHFIWTPAP